MSTDLLRFPRPNLRRVACGIWQVVYDVWSVDLDLCLQPFTGGLACGMWSMDLDILPSNSSESSSWLSGMSSSRRLAVVLVSSGFFSTICVHVHVRMCTCAHVCMYACVRVCMCACALERACVCVRARVHVLLSMHAAL